MAAITGALTVQPAARGALTRAVDAVAHGDRALAAPDGGSAEPYAASAAETDAPLADRIGATLDAEGTTVQRPDLGSLVAAVPAGAAARAEAQAAVAAVDDEAVRLRSAVKARDGFFTTFFISPYSRYIARWCARRGLTPNQVTTASLLTALIAAGCAATGTRGGYVAAGLLLLFSFVLDCTDGQLARYSLQYSTMGAWLDATFDRAKEYAYYAGLALGAARGGDDVWALALGAMVLQTCRHVVDFAFNEANVDATAASAAGKAVVGTPTAALSSKLDSVGWTVWVRRMIVLPIGERWAGIAVLTAVTTPRIVFYALLVGCAFAACYTTAGRVLRSVTRKAIRTERAAGALAALTDSGPLAGGVAALLRRPARRLPGVLPFLVALAGGVVVVATAAFAPHRRPLARRRGGGLRPDLGHRGGAAPDGSARLARAAGVPGRRVQHRPAPRRPLRGERSVARGFRTGGGGRLPSLRHGVPHSRRHGRAAPLARQDGPRTRGPDAGDRRRSPPSS